MAGGEEVRELFAHYCKKIDEALISIFDCYPDIEMYKHMSYFMGFRDENLEPTKQYGGKRFRSSLAYMLGDWYGAGDKMLDVATSIELFHNFTLIHDDIVDGDDLRRGRKTVWKLFGTDHAINSGDGQLLLALEVITKSSRCTPEEKIAIYNFLSEQYRKVVEGQFLDFTQTALPLGDKHVTENEYFKMVGRKTADLIAAATKVPGIVAGKGEEERERLFLYGYDLGLAYQLCDDCVSIWGSEEDTGKRAYGDILERKKTFPILYAYKLGNEEEKEKLRKVFNGDNVTVQDAEMIVQILDAHDVYTHTKNLYKKYAQEAKEVARTLDISDENKNTLIGIVDVLLPDIKTVD